MYRKRASVLAIKSISSSFYQVSSSYNSSPSSQNNLLNCIKTSHLSRPRRGRSFSVSVQRSDFSPDLEPVGPYQQNPSVSDRRNSLNILQNPNGYQSNDLGKVRQWNSNDLCDESAVGSYRRDLSGVDLGSSTSLQQDPNGLSRGSSDMRQRCDLAEFQQANSNDSYQRTNIGEAQHLNSNGFYWENPNGHASQATNFSTQNRVAEFRREGSRIGGQVNKMNIQNMVTNADGIYRERSGDVGQINWNSVRNSLESSQQKPRALSGGSRLGDGYPFENQSVFFRENQMNCNSVRNQTGNSVESSQQKPRILSGDNRVGRGYPYENQPGSSRENQMNWNSVRNRTGNSVESSQQNPRVLSGGSIIDDEYPYENHRGFFGENQMNWNSVRNYTGDSVESSQQNPRVLFGGSITGAGYPYENRSGLFRENQINWNSVRNHTGNSVESSHENQSVISGGSRAGGGYPYGNQSGFCGGNQINQTPISNHTGNSVEGFQQNPRVLSGCSRIHDGYPYENQGGFFRENNIEFHQEPTRHNGVNPEHRGYYNVDPGQLYQKSYDSHGKNPLPYGQQNLIESPALGSAKHSNELYAGGSLGTGEMNFYEGTLKKLEEFCKGGKVKEAVACFSVFEKSGMVIDLPRYLKLVQACGEAKSLEKARVVNDYLSRRLGEVEVLVHNKILDMYSKCGSMADAYQLFEKMPCRNLTSWETMIKGLSDNGLWEEAIDLFTQFKKIGLKPDGGLFAAVFYTCSLLGAVDQGMLYYKSMRVDFGIVPVMEHYVSMVDMFGRSGHLDEALEFIEAMPIEPNVNVWETLMNFCRVNGYAELGDRCAEIVEQLDSSRLTEQSKMGLLPIKALEITKEQERKENSEFLDVKHHMHQYMAGRPENYMIYERIRCLAQQMKEAGYVPDAALTLHDIDQESREEALLYHSERLAIVHGLMTSSVQAPIRIIKNLRVCRDCHNALKIISKLTGRLIIARDTKRFHHFQNGVCSCNDFW